AITVPAPSPPAGGRRTRRSRAPSPTSCSTAALRKRSSHASWPCSRTDAFRRPRTSRRLASHGCAGPASRAARCGQSRTSHGTRSGARCRRAGWRRVSTMRAIIEQLTRIHGVGWWTVEMLLIFTLGRPDVLPVDDFGVREGYRVAYGRRARPTPEALRAFGERWKPYRSVAAWYLWRAASEARTKINP